MFTNGSAARVAVLAMPHNVNASDTTALVAALKDLQQYSCARISSTKLHYPPIPGSDSSVALAGATLPLGYDEKNSVLRSKLEVTTTFFPTSGCVAGGPPLQIVFPHHRKVMNATNKQNILIAGSRPQYTWQWRKRRISGLQGRLVRSGTGNQRHPSLPAWRGAQLSVANPLQPGQSAAADIYETMKTWFYVQEPVPAPNKLNSVLRNLGTYMGFGINTYIPGLAGVYESLVIADQLAQSTALANEGVG